MIQADGKIHCVLRLEEPVVLERRYYSGRDLPDGSMVKNLPAMRETRVQSLGQEDLLEEEMATHSSTLA